LGKEYIKDLEGLSMRNMDEKKVKVFAVQFKPEDKTKAYLGLLEIVCGYYQFELRDKLLRDALVKTFDWLDIIEIYTIFEKALNFLLREAEDNKEIQYLKSRQKNLMKSLTSWVEAIMAEDEDIMDDSKLFNTNSVFESLERNPNCLIYKNFTAQILKVAEEHDITYTLTKGSLIHKHQITKELINGWILQM
jgi:hypothetical protein